MAFHSSNGMNPEPPVNRAAGIGTHTIEIDGDFDDTYRKVGHPNTNLSRSRGNARFTPENEHCLGD
jgi:hypothetical protein